MAQCVVTKRFVLKESNEPDEYCSKNVLLDLLANLWSEWPLHLIGRYTLYKLWRCAYGYLYYWVIFRAAGLCWSAFTLYPRKTIGIAQVKLVVRCCISSTNRAIGPIISLNLRCLCLNSSQVYHISLCNLFCFFNLIFSVSLSLHSISHDVIHEWLSRPWTSTLITLINCFHLQ